MKQKIVVLVCSIAILWSLLACKWLDMTTVQPDGSGEYREDIGYSPEELSKQNPKTFCQPGSNPNIRITTERRGDDTWCAAAQAFANISELRTIYGGIKLDSSNTVTVNQLEMKNRAVYYDVSVDWTALPTTVVDIQWRVSLPGKVIDSNADKVEGNTLIWSFRDRRMRNLHAVSSLFVILPPLTIRPDR